VAAFLILGFFLGIRHALEADHVAAVASLATRSPRLASTVRVAAAWGAGHALTLVVFGSLLIAFDLSPGPAASRVLESIVGVMLILLGLDVLRRLRREHIHVHAHEHEGLRHVHAHGHAGEAAHDAARHRHEHGLLPRALLVGGVHGMAGTAGFTLLSLAAIRSTAGAFLYLALFGLGSILGMVLLSLVISLPLHLSAPRLSRRAGGLEAGLGAATIALGGWIVVQAAVLGVGAS
jgi:sulfite exporter TauE/SafE